MEQNNSTERCQVSNANHEIRNTEDVLDSRDIIARIEALEALDERDEDERDELKALTELADEASGYSGEWNDGATLVRYARLIASAPALLAALTKIADGLDNYMNVGDSSSITPYEAIEVARAAIALATETNANGASAPTGEG